MRPPAWPLRALLLALLLALLALAAPADGIRATLDAVDQAEAKAEAARRDDETCEGDVQRADAAAAATRNRGENFAGSGAVDAEIDEFHGDDDADGEDDEEEEEGGDVAVLGAEEEEDWATRRARRTQEQIDEIKEKIRRRREEREANGTDDVRGFFRRTLGLPLHDVRFTLGVGVVLTILVFLMNLVYQYDVERKNDPEGKRELASANHMHSFAAMHLIREKLPTWMPLEVLDRVEDILMEDLYDWSEGQDGSLVVDTAFLVRFLRASARHERAQARRALRRRQRRRRDRLAPTSAAVAQGQAEGQQAGLFRSAPWHVDETSILGASHRVNKPLRSRGTQTLRLLVHGPDSPDDVLLDEEELRVVVDHLTQTLVICLRSSRRHELRDLATCTARSLRNPDGALTSVTLAPGSEPIYVVKAVARQLKRVEASLLRGKVADIVQEHEDFQVQITGLGLSGSVAVALVTAIYAVPVGLHQDWAFAGDRRKVSAMVFGPMPAVAGLQESSEAMDRVVSFIHDADVWPRLSPRALRRAKVLYSQLETIAPATERLERMLEKTTDQASRDAVRELVDSHPGVLTTVDPDEDSAMAAALGLDSVPDVRHVGRVVVLQRQGAQPDVNDIDALGDEDEDVDVDDDAQEDVDEEDGDLDEVGEEEEEENDDDVDEEGDSDVVQYGWHEVNPGAAARLSLIAATDCIACHDAARYEEALKKAIS